MGTFTIQTLVESQLIEGLRLVSGEQQQTNIIRNVNIIDNPDSFEWFTAGDFLLTTGYVFKDSEELQLRLIEELSELNCSGLGIKIKRYWESIPETILSEARKRGFPIVEIPFTYSLAQVANLINDEVRERESSDLARYRTINNTFLKCSLEGGDLWQIAKLASNMVQNPIILLDSAFQLLSYHETANNPYPLKDYLRLKERERVFPRTYTDSFPTNTQDFTVSIKREIKVDDHSIMTRVIPIAHSHVIYGYVVVWRTGPALESIDYVALESAAQTAALERIKTKQLLETQNKQREDFYDDLIQGRIISNNALKSLAKVYGLQPTKKYIVGVFQTLNGSEEVMRDIAFDLEDETLVSKRDARFVVRGETIFVFLSLEEEEALTRDVTPSVREFFSALYQRIQQRHKKQSVVVGVSNSGLDLMELSRASNIALDVIRISGKLQINPPIYFFSDLISYHLIESSLDNEAMITYFQQTLGVLHDYDYKNHSDLLHTLDQYFLSLGNVSLTAKRMFIHRNTIIYRLEKIKEILQNDLRDPEKNFNYQMGLKIYRIMQLHQNLQHKQQ